MKCTCSGPVASEKFDWCWLIYLHSILTNNDLYVYIFSRESCMEGPIKQHLWLCTVSVTIEFALSLTREFWAWPSSKRLAQHSLALVRKWCLRVKHCVFNLLLLDCLTNAVFFLFSNTFRILLCTAELLAKAKEDKGKLRGKSRVVGETISKVGSFLRFVRNYVDGERCCRWGAVIFVGSCVTSWFLISPWFGPFSPEASRCATFCPWNLIPPWIFLREKCNDPQTRYAFSEIKHSFWGVPDFSGELSAWASPLVMSIWMARYPSLSSTDRSHLQLHWFTLYLKTPSSMDWEIASRFNHRINIISRRLSVCLRNTGQAGQLLVFEKIKYLPDTMCSCRPKWVNIDFNRLCTRTAMSRLSVILCVEVLIRLYERHPRAPRDPRLRSKGGSNHWEPKLQNKRAKYKRFVPWIGQSEQSTRNEVSTNFSCTIRNKRDKKGIWGVPSYSPGIFLVNVVKRFYFFFGCVEMVFGTKWWTSSPKTHFQQNATWWDILCCFRPRAFGHVTWASDFTSSGSCPQEDDSFTVDVGCTSVWHRKREVRSKLIWNVWQQITGPGESRGNRKWEWRCGGFMGLMASK